MIHGILTSIFFLVSSSNSKPIVAVLPLIGHGIADESLFTITDALSNRLVQTGKMRVLERSQINSILAEQGFQNSGACDSSECAVEVGKLLSVEYIIVGTIGKIGESYSISARLVSIQTGEIIKSSQLIQQGPIENLVSVALPMISSEISGITLADKNSNTKNEIHHSNWERNNVISLSTTIPFLSIVPKRFGKTANFGYARIICLDSARKYCAYPGIDYGIVEVDILNPNHTTEYDRSWYFSGQLVELKIDALYNFRRTYISSGIELCLPQNAEPSKNGFDGAYWRTHLALGFRVLSWLDLGISANKGITKFHNGECGSDYQDDIELQISFRI